MSLRPQRTRRTKVYDCNYDIGQRYYKPVVDDLDRKYSGRTSADSPGSGLGSLRSALEEAESSLGASSARRAAREASAEELEESATLRELLNGEYVKLLNENETRQLEKTNVSSRRRPLSSLMDDFDNIFESRGSRATGASSSSRSALAAIEDGDEESTPSSRLRAARARAQAIEDEFSSSMSSSLSSRKAKAGLDYSEKVLDTVGLKNSDITRARQALAEDSFGSSSTVTKRSLKVSASQPDGGDFAKWTKLSEADLGVGQDDDFDSGAAAVRARKKAKARLAEIEAELGTDFAAGAAADRARKSRARLADLEAEMEAVADRSAARERRAAGLRALVAENEASADASSSSTSSMRVRKVTSSVQSEKKTVTF